jgi:predicted DNA-binding transcriptional regulator AlpA
MSIFKEGRKPGDGADLRKSDVDVRNISPTNTKEVLTPEDLAELLGISVWTIYARTSKCNRNQTKIDLPPFFRMGKLIRFWRRDLVSWLENRNKIDPNKP